MKYGQTVSAVFISRPNRFIAVVSLNGEETIVHVKNTGRCKELLVAGCTVVLEHATNPHRKTAYDLIAVYKGDLLINMDSQAPNKVAREYLEKRFPAADLIKPEYTIGESRLDFYVEQAQRPLYVEVKGVTLEDQGVVRFPDAPTIRGIKHLHELTRLSQEGNQAMVIFVVQLKGACYMEPNYETHPEFGEALKVAKKAGVEIVAFDCYVNEGSLVVGDLVEVRV